jgi:uncharacterized membrane protein YczE
LNKKYIFLRILINIISSSFIALGVILFLRCNLGSDPTTILIDGLRRVFCVQYSVASIVFSTIILIIAVIFSRKYIFIGTVISTICISLFIYFMETLIPVDLAELPLIYRYTILLSGELIGSIGTGFIIATRFGMGAIDAIANTISDHTKIKYQWLRACADGLYTFCGFLMGGTVGVGTIIAVLFTGYLVSVVVNFCNKRIITAFKLS